MIILLIIVVVAALVLPPLALVLSSPCTRVRGSGTSPFRCSGRCWCSTDAKGRPAGELIRAVRPSIGTSTRFSDLCRCCCQPACPYGPSSLVFYPTPKRSDLHRCRFHHKIFVKPCLSRSLFLYIYIARMRAAGMRTSRVCL